ncbi:unnamed protein product [Anisakis simplex]|uniref:MULE domain-containing protein n=1 Tax=Anisakis simplex TaxID=6269 RepID=A0A0M3K656_ANISI|nr:unnamed protein product [Anisakis simplex]
MACTTNPERLNSMIKEALRGSFPSSLIGYLSDHDDSRSLLWEFFVSNRDEVIFGDVESSYYMLAAMKK